MSKADELLRELADAACGYVNKMHETFDDATPQWEKLRDVNAQVQAYLNEKPHEPPPDLSGVGAGEYTGCLAQVGKPVAALASPPHAAAEPEKPVAWMYRWHDAISEETRLMQHRWAMVVDPWTETPLYAAAPPPAVPPHTHRWNMEPTDEGLRVCQGGHQSAEQCEWEYFVPKTAAPPPIAREPTPDQIPLLAALREIELRAHRLDNDDGIAKLARAAIKSTEGEKVSEQYLECSMDEECPMCTGAICNLCGAGMHYVETVCEHDTLDRHQIPLKSDGKE